MMSESIQMVNHVPRRELLAKAKELQAARSFATSAVAGLTLYLRGDKDKEVLQMFREGIRFCELCLRDLEVYEPKEKYKFTPDKGPRYYSPSEVILEPSSVPDLKKKAESIRDILNSILTQDKSVPEEIVKECQGYIRDLLAPYRMGAAVSLGEFKYGPTLRK